MAVVPSLIFLIAIAVSIWIGTGLVIYYFTRDKIDINKIDRDDYLELTENDKTVFWSSILAGPIPLFIGIYDYIIGYVVDKIVGS